MPRLVRRAPFSERVAAYLDPHDWFMWLSEELNTHDWDDFASAYSLPLGFGMNLVFIIAQSNASNNYDDDDLLVDSGSGGGWFCWFCRVLVLGLSSLSFLNAFMTFSKRRHYRLFEQSVESLGPATPSAQRVRIDSAPSAAAASPLRYVKRLITPASAESRAHPDITRDVWEVAIWDPNPLCLDMFCFFSPLHVVLYYLTLPVAPLDPQPSVKVATSVLIGAGLSLQAKFMASMFTQQIKDNGIIQKEVLHEYDSKFVHAQTQKVCRDVGIQTISKKTYRDSSVGVRGSSSGLASEVTTYSPTIVISRTFKTGRGQGARRRIGWE